LSKNDTQDTHNNPRSPTGWAPGRPDSTPIAHPVAQSPVRNPIAGIPFSNYAGHPAVVGPTGAEVRTISNAVVDRAGGPMIRPGK
jgi:hypothetical protein